LNHIVLVWQRRVTTINQYLIAKVQNIFETKEDFEKKDKIIVMTGQVLRELARFVVLY
jgi:hypothetical protein